MKEVGMLFSCDMVRAIQDNRKTRTMRPIAGIPREAILDLTDDACFLPLDEWRFILPDGSLKTIKSLNIGDRIYVRETWTVIKHDPQGTQLNFEKKITKEHHFGKYIFEPGMSVIYRASDEPYISDEDGDNERADGTERSYWYPSIHMPKWAARIWLKVTNIKIQRVQEVTELEARAEGVKARYGIASGSPYYCPSFYKLWKSLYGLEAVQRNDWCIVTEFKRVEAE